MSDLYIINGKDIRMLEHDRLKVVKRKQSREVKRLVPMCQHTRIKIKYEYARERFEF